jgi:hypothetical protein
VRRGVAIRSDADGTVDRDELVGGRTVEASMTQSLDVDRRLPASSTSSDTSPAGRRPRHVDRRDVDPGGVVGSDRSPCRSRVVDRRSQQPRDDGVVDAQPARS